MFITTEIIKFEVIKNSHFLAHSLKDTNFCDTQYVTKSENSLAIDICQIIKICYEFRIRSIVQ